MREITIDDLETIFSQMIERLKLEDERSFKFENDLYKIIPADKWHDLNNPSTVIGSIFDDIDELEKILKDEDRVCNYVDFDRFASILRQISQIVNPI